MAVQAERCMRVVRLATPLSSSRRPVALRPDLTSGLPFAIESTTGWNVPGFAERSNVSPSADGRCAIEGGFDSRLAPQTLSRSMKAASVLRADLLRDSAAAFARQGISRWSRARARERRQ